MPAFVKTAVNNFNKLSIHQKQSTGWKTVSQVYVKTTDGWKPIWSYSWETGNWSECSATCGGGTQTRTVQCKRNDDIYVVDGLCPDIKPATQQVCNTQDCYTYSWYSGSWSWDSETCGKSYATRTVYCRRSDGTKVSDSYCSGSKPSTSTSATDCSSCSYDESYYLQSKVRHCNNIAQDGKTNWTLSSVRSAIYRDFKTIYSHYLGCNAVEKTCGYSTYCCSKSENGPACSIRWITGSWGSCSATCGSGTKTRSVTCQDGTSGASVSTTACNNALFITKPATSQSCTVCTSCSWSESSYIANKVDQCNATAVDGRTNWTASQVRSAISANGFTPYTHYLEYGAKEGVCPWASSTCCRSEGFTYY